MIRHCVFIRFRADVSQAERASIFADIRALQPRIPGFLALHIGANASSENLDKGFSNGFIVDFSNEAARDRYLEDEAHRAAGGRLVAAAEGGSDGILVYDLVASG